MSFSELSFTRETRTRAIAGLNKTLERHPEVFELLSLVRSRQHHWAIVGGAPRHWALDGLTDPTDIDIVVGTSSSALETILYEWNRKPDEAALVSETALGGFRLVGASWTLDIWSVEKTIGVSKGLVKDRKSFRAVSRSAALSLDSLVLTSRGTVYETGFFKTLRTGILCMNHCSIERPDKIAKKALRLCERFQLVPDISLHAFISSYVADGAVERLLEERASASSRADVTAAEKLGLLACI